LASLEVVIHSSSFIGLPQYVSFIWGLATCTLPIPLAWRIFISADSYASRSSILLFYGLVIRAAREFPNSTRKDDVP